MRRIAFFWDNFGPMHIDRCDAVGTALAGRAEVLGIEFYAASRDYGWARSSGRHFRKLTLFEGARPDRIRRFRLAYGIVRACRRLRADTVFLCGHGQPGILLAACLLRLLGYKIFAMTDSKFDDKPRSALKEAMKFIYYMPYMGALVAGNRSKEYMQFLGFRRRPIELFYDNIAISRIKMHACNIPTFQYADRNFICVARLVDKKNHSVLIEAYARYMRNTDAPRRLVLCGSGPLEGELRALAANLGVSPLIDFEGWLSEGELVKRLAQGLCLILPSIEEQFGIAVLEAQAMGLPVILSDKCGARDQHVRTGVNGFVVETDNEEGLAYFMAQLAGDEQLWRRLSENASASSDLGDIGRFVDSIRALARLNLRGGAS